MTGDVAPHSVPPTVKPACGEMADKGTRPRSTGGEGQRCRSVYCLYLANRIAAGEWWSSLRP